jgi:hypothetical protein
LENFLILPHGGVTRRPGLKHVAEVKDSSKQVRLIPFEFSITQAYVLEFGDQYIRFYKDNAIIVEDTTPVAVNGDFETAGGGGADIWGTWVETAGDGAIAAETDNPYWGTESAKLTAGATANTEITQASITTIESTKYYLTFWTKGDGTNAGRYSIYDVSNAGYIDTNVSTGITGTDWKKVQFSFTTPASCIQIRIELECPATNGGIAWFDQVSVDGYPVEVASPYLEADLPELYFTQSADFLYIVHEDYAPRTLTRTSHTAWTLSTITFVDGPYLDTNPEEDQIVTPSGLTGDITLTASGFSWDSDQVGALWRLRLDSETDEANATWGYALITSYVSAAVVNATVLEDLFGVDGIVNGDMELDSNWTSDGAPTTNEQSGEQFHGKEYSRKIVASGADQGIKSDAFDVANGQKYEVTLWVYPDDTTNVKIEVTKGGGAGTDYSATTGSLTQDAWNKVTISYTSTETGASAQLYILSTAAGTWYVDDVTHKHITGTWEWREGCWSTLRGFPRCVTFFEGRLFFGASVYQPQTIWGSCSDDFPNFTPGVNDDDAIQFTIGSDQVNVVQWISPSTQLIIGTVAAEFKMGGGSSDIITPTSIAVKSPTTYGGKQIRPIRAGNAVIFVQRAGKKLREYTYSLEIDNYNAEDLTILAEHITGDGVIAMDYQQEPDSIIWCARSDGMLLGLTYNKYHKVVGWHRHPLTGSVESLCVIPSTDGIRDELWAVINRTIDGGTKRYIEYVDPDVNTDSSLTYSGSAVTALAGLEHLEGETVAMVGDGAVYASQVVTDGKVTLNPSAEEVEVGIAYTSYLKTMRPEVETKGGTSQGRRKRWVKIQVRVYETLGAKILGEIIPFRSAAHDMDEPPPVFSGIIEKTNLGWDLDGQIEITQDQPLPITILSIMGIIDINA